MQRIVLSNNHFALAEQTSKSSQYEVNRPCSSRLLKADPRDDACIRGMATSLYTGNPTMEAPSSTVLGLVRAPIMPLLTLLWEDRNSYKIFAPFKPPATGYACYSAEELPVRTLGVRVRTFLSARCSTVYQDELQVAHPSEISAKVTLPDNPDTSPLVLWQSSEMTNNGLPAHSIVVDPLLSRYLREHQRDGVRFMFECLTGLREIPYSSQNENGECVTHPCVTPLKGCILADDMGLGKTLQSITVLWTLLHQGFDKKPVVRKAIVVCPASLVRNWASEIEKWLGDRCPCTPVLENSREQVVNVLSSFLLNKVSRILIVSYETLRLHGKLLATAAIDMVICDEAHRLKNDKTRVVNAILALPTVRRLLISGTPIQNDLEELYAMSSLCVSVDVLGTTANFRKSFINPIMLGRQKDASENAKSVSNKCIAELSHLTNLFILRRTNIILAELLPPKTILAVFCHLSPTQEELYKQAIQASAGKQGSRQKGAGGEKKQALKVLQTLMKICSHPLLVEEDKPCTRILPLDSSVRVRQRRNCSTDFQLSGKLHFIVRLVQAMRQLTELKEDRVVIISNFTRTLDIVECILTSLGIRLLRLDGNTPLKRRSEIVSSFNNPATDVFGLLLSSKAGGCGINLIGGNRLIMLDPDWNPANDKQALARIWREGQKKRCYIYRLFSTGTVEEKIFCRQMQKDSLSGRIMPEGDRNGDSANEPLFGGVRDLFCYNEKTLCETHDLLACTKCSNTESSEPREADDGVKDTLTVVDENGRYYCVRFQQDGMQESVWNYFSDLRDWSHHPWGVGTPDLAMNCICETIPGVENIQPLVTFAMCAQVEKKRESIIS